jgi:hypothetical protein
MVNIHRNWALGATIFGSFADDVRFGVRPRLRRWLDRDWSLDISPGLVLAGEYEGHYVDDTYHPAFAGSVSLGFRDALALRFQVESFEVAVQEYDWESGGYPERHDEALTEYYVGASLCSHGGFLGLVLLGIAALIYAANPDFDWE